MLARYTLLLGVMLMALASLTGCQTQTANPGIETVLMDKPLLFGRGGVRPEPLRNGRIITWLSTSGTDVDMRPQTIKVAFDDFTTSDKFLLDFESAMQVRVTDSVRLVTAFGEKDWFKNNVQSQYTSIVRDAVKHQSMTLMMSDPATAIAVDKEVTEKTRALFKERNLPIELIDITLGRALPNPEVRTQMNETAAQQQRKLTLDAAANAEDSRKIEQGKRADADNEYRNKMNMSVEQFTALEIAKVNAEACKAAKECVLAPAGTSVLVNK